MAIEIVGLLALLIVLALFAAYIVSIVKLRRIIDKPKPEPLLGVGYPKPQEDMEKDA